MSYREPLVIDEAVANEIVKEIWLKFQLHSGSMSFHFDTWGISIMIYADDQPFRLLRGPMDVRTDGQNFETFLRTR